MIILRELVISLPILLTPSLELKDNFADSISYDSLYVIEPGFKDTMHYNTLTNEELIRENNERIIQQIYKSLE